MTDSPVSLVWITPEAERLIVHMARVSADPAKRARSTDAQLVRFLIRNQHWSPFEMANICVEVNTSRAIGRQMLRHWTMRPQEFSQRYQDVSVLGDPIITEARFQHPTNRQASIPAGDDDALGHWWQDAQREVWDASAAVYEEALESGIAKEQARSVLPEGMTPTKMYFNCPVRSALHFCALRSKEHGSQDEIVALAEGLWSIMEQHMPVVCEAFARHLEIERARKALPETLRRWAESCDYQLSAVAAADLHAMLEPFDG